MDSFEKKNREEETELISLRYEVASAKRQIASLQGMLSAKNREAAGLRDQLIERDVLLKEAALGARTFWPATTHVLGGVLCLNIKTFMLALGSTVGGTLESTVRALLGS